MHGNELLYRNICALLIICIHARRPVIRIAVSIDCRKRGHRDHPGHVSGILGNIDCTAHTAFHVAQNFLHPFPYPFLRRIVIIVFVQQIQIVQHCPESCVFRRPAHSLRYLKAERNRKTLGEDRDGPPLWRYPKPAEVISHFFRLVNDHLAVGFAYPSLAGKRIGHCSR